jgi:ACS family hexuronate transporter-like MFS transporter
MASLNSAFLVAYGLMYLGGGKLMDVVGTRLGFALIMVFWSLACASHGLANSVMMLVISRLLLGIGEGGGFPAATRAVAEWFPVRERSTAMGIMNAGTAVGGIMAPPLIAAVLMYADWLELAPWRWVFYLTGAMGLLWTLWWCWEYFAPEKHPRLGVAEREEIRSVFESDVIPKSGVPLLQLLRFRETWGLVTAKFLSDAAWYFYLFWLPRYLYDARGFDIKAVGSVACIPHAAAGIGCLCGGGLSTWLLARRYPLDRARKLALGASAAMMPLLAFVPHVSVTWAIVLFCIGYFGQQSWSTLVMILPTDLFPKRAVGTVAGLVGLGGAMGGIAFGQLAGYLLDHGVGYAPIFVLVSTFHVLAFGLILLMVRTVRPLELKLAADPRKLDSVGVRN